MDGDGIELIAPEDSPVYFDYNNDGITERSGWVMPDDALLAHDVNANGSIDNLSELFGNLTIGGFEELQSYDSNSDGFINADDAIWKKLQAANDNNLRTARAA